MMGWAMAGQALGGILGGIVQGNAADDAADAQSQAAREATQLQREMYNQARADQEPWRAAGVRALAGMEDKDFQRDFTANDFQADPGYAFRMAEGQKALERSAAARGGLMSGGTLKGLTQYAQGVASEEFGNAYNRFNADRDRRFGRLSSLAGMGQNSAQSMGSHSMNFGQMAGNNMIGAGDARAAASMTKGQIWGNTLSGLGKMGMEGAAGAQQQGNQTRWMDIQERALKSRGY